MYKFAFRISNVNQSTVINTNSPTMVKTAVLTFLTKLVNQLPIQGVNHYNVAKF